MSQDFPEPVAGTSYPPDEYGPGFAVDSVVDSSSTTDVAKEQAAGVAHSASDAGQHVAGVAKEQVSNVASEASTQAKNLLSQTRTELQEQAATQQQRIAAGIRSLSEELGSMAANSQQAGTASDLARQASQRAGDVAGWLEERDPGALLGEVAAFARRRPGAFLAIAAGAGLLAGRLTRGVVAAAHDDTDTSDSDTSTPPLATSGSYATDTSYVGGTDPAAPVATGAAVLPVDPPAYETSSYEPLEPWDGPVRP